MANVFSKVIEIYQGNVGIGTTTPSQLLVVQGNALISGNITGQNNLSVTGLATAQAFWGIGTYITNLNASNLTQGTVPPGVMSGTYTGITSIGILTQLYVTGLTTSLAFFGIGTYLTNLNANNLSQGIVPSTAISGQYAGITSVGTLTELDVSTDILINNLTIGLGSGQVVTNIAIGYQALQNNVGSGSNNLIEGYLSGQFLGANTNIAIGNYSLQGSVSTSIVNGSNISIGYGAGRYLNSPNNVIIGHLGFQGTLTTFISNGGNTLIGYGVGQYLTSANNVAVGYIALSGAVTQLLASGNNTVIGYAAGQYLNSSANVAVGYKALQGAPVVSITGSANVAVGYQAGELLTSGSNNTFIGYQASGTATGQYQISIGYNVVATGSNNGAWGGNSAATYTDLGLGTFIAFGRHHIETLISSKRGLYVAGVSGQSANLIQVDATTLGTSYYVMTGVGSIGMGTTAPLHRFHLLGDAAFQGLIFDGNSSSGLSGQILSATGSGIAWTNISLTGIVTGTGTLNSLAKFGASNYLVNSIVSDNGLIATVTGGVNITGLTTSQAFWGIGTYLTNLNASNLSQGTVLSAVISGSYSGITSVGALTQLYVTGLTTSLALFGIGTYLTNLNASNLSQGTVPSAVISGSYSGITSVGALTQLYVTGLTTSSAFFGIGTYLTNLNASNLSQGAVSSAVISGQYSGITSVGALTQLYVTGLTTSLAFFGIGTYLTNLNASNLSQGTVPSAVISGQYSGITSVGTLAQLNLPGYLYDSNNNAGTTGQLLSATGPGIAWTNISLTGIVTGAGTLNNLAKFGASNYVVNSIVSDNGLIATVTGGVNITGLTTASAFFGIGTYLTNLNASNLSQGTVPSAVISGQYSGITSVGALTQLYVTGLTTALAFFGIGTYLTNLNASNLSQGTVPSAVISGQYSGITSVGALTQLYITGISTFNSARIRGGLYDLNNSLGTSNQVLTTTGQGIAWSSISSTGIVTGTGNNSQIGYWNNSNQITGISTFVYTGIGSVGIGTANPAASLSVWGNVYIAGVSTAQAFFGIGTYLTNLNASNLSQGTVPSAVISGQYSGITSVGALTQLYVTGLTTSLAFFGIGTYLTNLNASNLSQGTVPSAVISGQYSGITSVGALTQLYVTGLTTSKSFFGIGTYLTNLNASNLSQGTVPSAVISGSYSGITSVGALTQLYVTGLTTSLAFFGIGTYLTNLNASNLSQGTVPSAVISGQYSGITSVGTLSQLYITGLGTLNNANIIGTLYDVNNSPGTQVGIASQVLFSTGVGVSWYPIKRSIVYEFMTAFTPASVGTDSAVFIVPQDPIDGMTNVNFNIKRINFRVETPSTGITTLNVVKSTGTGVFFGTSIMSSNYNLTGSGTYEGFSTSFTGFGGTTQSNDKLSVFFVGVSATHQNFTVEIIMREA